VGLQEQTQTNLFTDLFQFRHPTSSKMAVLQHNPRAVRNALLYHLSRYWTLYMHNNPLAKKPGVHAVQYTEAGNRSVEGPSAMTP